MCDLVSAAEAAECSCRHFLPIWQSVENYANETGNDHTHRLNGWLPPVIMLNHLPKGEPVKCKSPRSLLWSCGAAGDLLPGGLWSQPFIRVRVDMNDDIMEVMLAAGRTAAILGTFPP